MCYKVIIADDHKLIRDGIKTYIRSNKNFEVIAEAENGKQLLELKELNEADIVVIDINMPLLDGIEATVQLKSQHPKIKVLALTMLSDGLYIKKMVKAGADGYLLKNCSKNEVIKALECLSENKKYYSNEVTDVIMAALNSDDENDRSKMPLTSREIEILKLVCEEYSNAEIAEKLFISPRTVDAHKRNLLEKTNSKNVAGLVLYAVDHGIITP